MNERHWKYWLLAIRPKTLTAAVVPVASGTALVRALGERPLAWVSLLALLSALFIQIGTNLVNDAIDFRKGADDENRVGPVRVTQKGIFTFQQVMAMGSFFFFLALLCGIPLVMRGGWPIFFVGVVSILLGYAYTAGPFPLAYLGLGDLFVILFFGVIAVGGIVYLHILSLPSQALVLGLQVGLLCAVLIAINNLRDVEGDRRVNKKTWPVRFGVAFARWEIVVLILTPFLWQIYWWWQGAYVAAIGGFLALPLAFKIIKSIFSEEPGPPYNRFLGQAAGLHLFFGLLMALGLLL